jgi:hypothetical protein
MVEANPAAVNGNAPRSVLLVRILLGLIPLAAGLYVLSIGQDTNWDLRNYHFYNPFAYLTGRMGHDVAVSHVATYYNPLMYIPFYYAVTGLPPKAVGFILGVIPGFNVLFLYAIARRVIDLGRPSRTAWFCLAAALLGLLGQTNLAEIGTSYADNILSLPVLAAVWLIVRFRGRLAAPGVAGWAVAAAAGLLSGAVFGLKQPFAVYCVGLCASFFGLALPWRRRFLLAFVFGLGVLGGAALTGGYWMLEMWERFGNPLFPYFNEVFKSPWGAEGSYRDERFIPKSLLVRLLFPIWFNIDPMQVGEVGFRDLRFSLIYVLLIVLLARAVYRLLKKKTTGGSSAPAQSDRQSVTRFFVIFTVVSFVVWMQLFGVYRYIIVCEFLAPLVIFLLMAALLRNPQRCLRLTAAAFVLLLVTLEPGDWGRKPWGADYFGFEAPTLADPQNTIVVVTGNDPMAYMIPFFPPEVRFLRIQGFVTGPSPTPNLTDRLMQAAIAKHTGPLFIIYRQYEEWSALNALEAYGLQMDRASCQEMNPLIEPQPEHPFYFCRVTKKP